MKLKPNRTHPPHQSQFRNHGFTLVELLVVITIIVTLATLSVFVTRNIRAKAYQANALSSLRQVAAFSVAYSTENNGDINTLRLESDPIEGGGDSRVTNSFWGRLQPFLFQDADATDQDKLQSELKMRLDKLFNSSDSSTMAGTVISGAKIHHDGSGLPVPFAFNENLYQKGEFLKVSSFSDPSRVLYAVYGFGFFNEEDGQTYVPMPTDGSRPTNNIYYLEDTKALAAFLDGHVETVQAPMPDRFFK